MDYFYLIYLVLGLCIGSFLNVIVYRMPIMIENPEAKFNIAFPASHCPVCKTSLKWWNNIPFFSYVFQGGKCSHCKTKIPIHYFLIELLSGLSFMYVYHLFGLNMVSLFFIVLFSVCIALFFIDINTKYLPDELNYILLWSGLLFLALYQPLNLPSAIVGVIGSYLFLYVLFYVYMFLRKKEGMGFGDFKLLASIAAWIPYKYLPLVLIIAVAFSLLLYAFKFKKKNEEDVQIPFGPGLIVGFLTIFNSMLFNLNWINLEWLNNLF